MNNKITAYKMLAMAGISWGLMACTSNNYDSINARDDSTKGYSLKAEFPTSRERLTVVVERQSTKGSGADYHDPGYDYRNVGQPPVRKLVEVRPGITTQDNFTLSANSIGFKWNVFDKPKLGLNLFFNAMQINSHIDIDVPAYLAKAPTAAQVKTSDVEFAHKVELYVPLSERVRLTGSLLLAGGNGGGGASLNTSGVGFDFLANKNFTLGLGYKRWHYDLDVDSTASTLLDKEILNFSSKSRVSLSTKGVSGELSYRF